MLLEFCPRFAPSLGTSSLPGWGHSCGCESPSGNRWDTATNPAVEGEGRKERETLGLKMMQKFTQPSIVSISGSLIKLKLGSK